jgi:hypothetical protein
MDKRLPIGSLAWVTKQYRPWTPQQTFLLPPSPTEWLPEGHLVYFIVELVRELDQRADDLPDEFQRRDLRLRRIREAKAALEKEAAQARAAPLRQLAAVQRRQAEQAFRRHRAQPSCDASLQVAAAGRRAFITTRR